MLPLLLGVVPFGLVFGVLGISSGLSETETILMSVLFLLELVRLFLHNYGLLALPILSLGAQ